MSENVNKIVDIGNKRLHNSGNKKSPQFKQLEDGENDLLRYQLQQEAQTATQGFQGSQDMASFCLQRLDVGLKKGKTLQEGVVKIQVEYSRPSDAARVCLSLLLAFVSHLGVHFSQPTKDQNKNQFMHSSLNRK